VLVTSAYVGGNALKDNSMLALARLRLVNKLELRKREIVNFYDTGTHVNDATVS